MMTLLTVVVTIWSLIGLMAIAAVLGGLTSLTAAVRLGATELQRSADAARAFRDQSERDGAQLIRMQREARDACLATMQLLADRAQFERTHIMRCEERYQARIQETREVDPAKPKAKAH